MPQEEWTSNMLVSQCQLCDLTAAKLLIAVLMSSRIREQGKRIEVSSYHGSFGFKLKLYSSTTDSSTTVLITVPPDRSGNRLNYGEVGNGKMPTTIELKVQKATDGNWFDAFDHYERSFTWDHSKEAPEAGFKEVIDGILLILAATALFHWIPALMLDAPSESVLRITSNLPSNFPGIMEFTKNGIKVSWNHQEDATKTFHSWNSIPGEPFGEVLIDVLVSHGQVRLPNPNGADDVNDVDDVNE